MVKVAWVVAVLAAVLVMAGCGSQAAKEPAMPLKAAAKTAEAAAEKLGAETKAADEDIVGAQADVNEASGTIGGVQDLLNVSPAPGAATLAVQAGKAKDTLDNKAKPKLDSARSHLAATQAPIADIGKVADSAAAGAKTNDDLVTANGKLKGRVAELEDRWTNIIKFVLVVVSLLGFAGTLWGLYLAVKGGDVVRGLGLSACSFIAGGAAGFAVKYWDALIWVGAIGFAAAVGFVAFYLWWKSKKGQATQAAQSALVVAADTGQRLVAGIDDLTARMETWIKAHPNSTAAELWGAFGTLKELALRKSQEDKEIAAFVDAQPTRQVVAAPPAPTPSPAQVVSATA
jgi:hypothetical protein